MIVEENERDSKPFKLDLSIGVATAMEGDSLVEILRVADQRMYEDKLVHHSGR
jgi:GGDEF domain-containing protein